MKTRIKKYILLFTGYFLLPDLALAQRPGSDARSLLNYFRGLFNDTLIPIFITLGLVYLISAVIGYIGANEDTAKKEEKKQQIFWGIIGLFVIISIWALVTVIGNTFNVFRGGTLQKR